jgi:hypothetical protein
LEYLAWNAWIGLDYLDWNTWIGILGLNWIELEVIAWIGLEFDLVLWTFD